MSTIISIINQKGGVGKTTIAVNLAACLAERGYRILIVDGDPQSNASISYGCINNSNTIYDLMINDINIENTIKNTSIINVDIIPSNSELYFIESQLDLNNDNDKLILKNKLSKISEKYHFIIIDAPPNLGMLSVNIMAASNYIIIPVKADYLSLQGLKELFNNYSRMKNILNPDLKVLGIVINMYNLSTILSRDVEENLVQAVGKLLFKTKIPQNIKIAESPSHDKPVIYHDRKSTGAISFLNFTREVLNRLNIYK